VSKLPFSTYINVGLEAADWRHAQRVEETGVCGTRARGFLEDARHKSNVSAGGSDCQLCFQRSVLPDHFASLMALTGSSLDPIRAKGAIYLSPIVDEAVITDARRRALVRRFQEVKAHNRLPTFLYLIQRL